MDHAERLSRIAIELVMRVRDEDPETNGSWLRQAVASEQDRFDLLFVLAAAIPDDRSWTDLTAWVHGDDHSDLVDVGECRRPSATGARSHRARGEKVCGGCRLREHDYDAARRERRKKPLFLVS